MHISIAKIAIILWMVRARNYSSWLSLDEAYFQQWTCIDDNNMKVNNCSSSKFKAAKHFSVKYSYICKTRATLDLPQR